MNPRALAFASFNAALNKAANVQCREGSWFEPVGDERFDVIACNPPYVISPDAAYTYRDSALPPRWANTRGWRDAKKGWTMVSRQSTVVSPVSDRIDPWRLLFTRSAT